MPTVIILTADQANKVRGLTTKGHALAPVPLKDGTFALPIEVLTDPAHAAFTALLKTLPTRTLNMGTAPATPGATVTDGEVATDPGVQSKYALKSDWQIGQLVALETTSVEAQPATL